MLDQLSPYMQRELHFFMGHPVKQYDLGAAFAAHALSHSPDISVSDWLDELEHTDIARILSLMFQYTLQDDFKTVLSGSSWEDVKGDPERMLRLLEAANISSNEVIDRLHECLRYPDETKHRYCTLLRRMYERLYQPFETEVIALSGSGIRKYRSRYEEDKEAFVEKYLTLVEEPETYVHVSFIAQVSSMFYHRSWIGSDVHWISLGIHTDRFLDHEPRKEQVDYFLKLLSDDKRIRIIEALAERPWYANELAKELKLTPAAVSYHMSFMFKLDLVDIRKQEQRHYYLLNKDKVKAYFELAQSVILKEPHIGGLRT